MSSSSVTSQQKTWKILFDKSNSKETWIKYFDFNKVTKKTRSRLFTKKKVNFKREKKVSFTKKPFNQT